MDIDVSWDASGLAALDLHASTVNSYRYRERGHRDDWAIGDLYVKRQALPEPPPPRIE